MNNEWFYSLYVNRFLVGIRNMNLAFKLVKTELYSEKTVCFARHERSPEIRIVYRD